MREAAEANERGGGRREQVERVGVGRGDGEVQRDDGTAGVGELLGVTRLRVSFYLRKSFGGTRLTGLASASYNVQRLLSSTSPIKGKNTHCIVHLGGPVFENLALDGDGRRDMPPLGINIRSRERRMLFVRLPSERRRCGWADGRYIADVCSHAASQMRND